MLIDTKLLIQTLLLHVMCLITINCELYTSVDELSQWPDITRQFRGILTEFIQMEEAKLIKLKKVQKSLSFGLKIHPEVSIEDIGTSKHMSNPINAFVTLNRLNRAIDTVEELLDSESLPSLTDESEHDNTPREQTSFTGRLRSIFAKIKQQLPANDDLMGSGEALLRLQSFYNMPIEDITRGVIIKNYLWQDEANSTDGQQVMNAEDCFELGRIAFQNNQFPTAIQWLYKSLEFATSKQEQDEDDYMLINDILEYMAFSAYKVGQIAYSAKLTQAWLERDPHNELALENLQYYLDELDQQQELNSTKSDEEPIQSPDVTSDLSSDMNRVGEITDIDSYSVSDDEKVRSLCQTSSSTGGSFLKCYKHTNTHQAYDEAKVEILNKEPKIIRIYDIISDQEARYLRREALPRLERSTVHSGAGHRPSDFRIAKTAWIRSNEDLVVERIETRLTSILGLSMDSSEALQVVNYGLGGFYGPHLDSARPTTSKANDSAMIKELERSERLATILMYLNHVEAGGSTVFPRLNVSVAPIERSAVVWFNIGQEGYSDTRTLHTGCPVLLGSKWIATKWPREAANTFRTIRL